MAEEVWIILIDPASRIAPDAGKSKLLISTAQKMPAAGNIRTAYRKTAKTIGNDGE